MRKNKRRQKNVILTRALAIGVYPPTITGID